MFKKGAKFKFENVQIKKGSNWKKFKLENKFKGAKFKFENVQIKKGSNW